MLWLDPSLAEGVLAYLAATRRPRSPRSATPRPARSCTRPARARWRRWARCRSAAITAGSTPRRCSWRWPAPMPTRTGDLALIDELWPSLLSRRRLDRAAMATPTATACRLCPRRGHRPGQPGLEGQPRTRSSTPTAASPWARSRWSRCRATPTPPSAAMAALAARRGDEAGAPTGAPRPSALRDGGRGALLDGGARASTPSPWTAPASPAGSARSNPGHLLFTGLPSPERAERVAAQLLSAASTPAGASARWRADEPRFNPMSYHNGSVWPHDTALCARWAGPLRRARRSGGAAERHVRDRGQVRDAPAGAVLRLPAPAPASRRSPIPSPACRRPGRRARCS